MMRDGEEGAALPFVIGQSRVSNILAKISECVAANAVRVVHLETNDE